jgi:16S rRNA G966 N2-methylase RsmD
MAKPSGNVLYYGDNLDVLRRHVPDESVDLVYLDPPFSSKPSKPSETPSTEASLLPVRVGKRRVRIRQSARPTNRARPP